MTESHLADRVGHLADRVGHLADSDSGGQLADRGDQLADGGGQLTAGFGKFPAAPGIAVVDSAQAEGLLAGFALVAHPGEGTEPLAAIVGWMDSDGRWTEDGDVVSDRLVEAACSRERSAASAEAVRRALDRLAGPIRTRLTLVAGRRWAAAEPTSSARRLVARLGDEVVQAARSRDRRTLQRLELATAFVGGGHTAGEAMLVDRMADVPRSELAAWLGRIPAPTPRWGSVEARLTGVVLFRRGDGVSRPG